MTTKNDSTILIDCGDTLKHISPHTIRRSYSLESIVPSLYEIAALVRKSLLKFYLVFVCDGKIAIMLSNNLMRHSARRALGRAAADHAGAPTVRASSGGTSYSTASASDLRSYPQYTVFGEYCMLSVKMLPPAFRLLRNNVLVLDSNKKGKILLEWTPRAAGDGKNVHSTEQLVLTLLSIDPCLS